MGKNKSKKQQNTEPKKTPSPTPAPATTFVPIVSCLYCEAASFDVNDRKNYSDHLTKAHNIAKNIEGLLDLTLKLQSGKKHCCKYRIKF